MPDQIERDHEIKLADDRQMGAPGFSFKSPEDDQLRTITYRHYTDVTAAEAEEAVKVGRENYDLDEAAFLRRKKGEPADTPDVVSSADVGEGQGEGEGEGEAADNEPEAGAQTETVDGGEIVTETADYHLGEPDGSMVPIIETDSGDEVDRKRGKAAASERMQELQGE